MIRALSALVIVVVCILWGTPMLDQGKPKRVGKVIGDIEVHELGISPRGAQDAPASPLSLAQLHGGDISSIGTDSQVNADHILQLLSHVGTLSEAFAEVESILRDMSETY